MTTVVSSASYKSIQEKERVCAPDGYHWMKSGKTYKLMKDPKGGYKPHRGASKSANFEIQKVHSK